MWAVFVTVCIFWHSWLYFGQGLNWMVLRTPAVMLPKFCKIIVVFWIYIGMVVYTVHVVVFGCRTWIAPPGPGCLGFGGATEWYQSNRGLGNLGL